MNPSAISTEKMAMKTAIALFDAIRVENVPKVFDS
jgi:hypothetical protein